MPDKVAPIRATTQDFLEIEDFRDDMVLFSDGSCVIILETNAVNFGLLSEKEQDALIFAYSGLLNSLSFPIQIYIRSKRKDITGYLSLLENAQNAQRNPVMATRIKQYRDFIAATVKERNVLDKKFYIVIPFLAIELGVGNVSSFSGKKGLPYSKSYILNKAKNTLFPRRDHLARQLARLGLRTKHLNAQQLIDLFHDVYNQGVVLKPTDIENYTSVFVGRKT